MSYAQASKIDFEKIPIIDITSLRNGEDKNTVAKKLHHASKNLGFIYIKNHGISKETIENIRKDGLKFFRSNEKNKSEIKKRKFV